MSKKDLLKKKEEFGLKEKIKPKPKVIREIWAVVLLTTLGGLLIAIILIEILIPRPIKNTFLTRHKFTQKRRTSINSSSWPRYILKEKGLSFKYPENLVAIISQNDKSGTSLTFKLGENQNIILKITKKPKNLADYYTATLAKIKAEEKNSEVNFEETTLLEREVKLIKKYYSGDKIIKSSAFFVKDENLYQLSVLDDTTNIYEIESDEEREREFENYMAKIFDLFIDNLNLYESK